MKKLLVGFIFFFVFPVSGVAPTFPVDQLNAAEHLRRVATHDDIASLLIDDAYTEQAKDIVFEQVKKCALQISREPNSAEQSHVEQLLKILGLQGAQVRVIDAQSIARDCCDIAELLNDSQLLHKQSEGVVRFYHSYDKDMEFVPTSNKIIQDICKSQVGRELVAAVCIRNAVIEKLPLIYSVFHGDRTNNGFVGGKRCDRRCLAKERVEQQIRVISEQKNKKEMFCDFWHCLSELGDDIVSVTISMANETNIFGKKIDSVTSLWEELLLPGGKLKTEECPTVQNGEGSNKRYSIKPLITGLMYDISKQEDIKNFFFDFWLRLSAFENEIFFAAILTVNSTNDVRGRVNIGGITNFFEKLFTQRNGVETEECPIVRNIAGRSSLYRDLLLKSLDLWNEWRTIVLNGFLEYNPKKVQKSGELICVCNEILRRTTSSLLEESNVSELFDIVCAIREFRSTPVDYSIAFCLNISDFSERMREKFKNDNKLRVMKGRYNLLLPHSQVMYIADDTPINLYHNFGVYIDVLYFNCAFGFFTKTLEKVAPHFCGYNGKDGQAYVSDDRQFYQTYGLRLIEHKNTQILLINKMSDFALAIEQGTQVPCDFFPLLPGFGLIKCFIPQVYEPLIQICGSTTEDYTRKLAFAN